LQHRQSPLFALWVDTFRRDHRFFIAIVGEPVFTPAKQTLDSSKLKLATGRL
jgi:hypothetical protein